ARAGSRRGGPAASRLRGKSRSAARRAVLVVRGVRLPHSRRDGGRLLRALPGTDGRVPRINQDRAPGLGRAAGGADLVAARGEVGGPGARGERRGLCARRGRTRRGRLLSRRRRRPQTVPSQVARRVVLESGGAAAHPAGGQGRRRRRHHGLRRPGLRRSRPVTLPPLAYHAIVGFVVLNVVIRMVPYVTLLERKFAGRMQSRIGPYYVGPHGLLQPIADALKLMIKEDVVPTTADRWVYNLAPIVFLVPCVLIFATLPFAPGLGVADLNIGVLFFLAVSSLEIVGLFMGGWGSNNKYALLSAMR